MTYLKNCPDCGHPAKQKSSPNGFVCCSDDDCPISRISIPVAAWQNWPRGSIEPRAETAEQSEQREQEIKRLQQRLREFGAVHQRNQELQREADDAKLRELNVTRQLKVKDDESHLQKQRAKKVLAEMEQRRLLVKKVTDWAIGGAQVSWASENTVYARFYEELLELLGKRDATKVPCEQCGQLPNQHQYISRPARLSCGCAAEQFTAEAWLSRQRRTKVTRLEDKAKKAAAAKKVEAEKRAAEKLAGKDLDIDLIRETATMVERGGNGEQRLLAAQTRLLLRQTELLERLTNK